jgi:hypothetical protein
MAGGRKEERRMVFDIRGRRRHVVKVVYAVLAVLMGASLFLVLGPVNVGSLIGNSGGGSEAGKISEEQAERIERKLRKNPEDPALLLSLTRTQLSAGNAQSTTNPTTGEVEMSAEAHAAYEKGSEAWSQYLAATDKPNAGVAQLMAPTLYLLAATSGTNEAVSDIKAAAEAQQIVANQRPTLSSLSKLAIYKTLAFDYAGGKKAGAEAKKLTQSKFERESLENTLEEETKRAKAFQQLVVAAKKEGKATGKENLENPLGGVGGSSLGQ